MIIQSLSKFLIRSIGRLPLHLRRKLGAGLGTIFGYIPTRDSRICALQLDLFMAEKGGRKLVPKVYSSLFQTALECCNLEPFLKDPNLVKIDRPEIAEKVRNSKTPQLILTGHCGNWDLLAAWAVSQGYKVSTIGREARGANMQDVLAWQRGRYGVNTLWRGDPSLKRDIIQCFQRRDLMAVLIDQDTEVESSFVPFFGRLAKTPSTLVKIAQRYDAYIISALLFRQPDGSYLLHLDEFEPGLDGDQVLRRFNQILQERISQYPDQWVWFHKRWRSLENGEKMSSQKYIDHLSTLLQPKTC